MPYIKAKSFTLIELLVVLIIIGILASIALPNYNKIKERTLDKEAIANLRLIQAAEKVYKMEMGSYYAASGASNLNPNLKLSLTETNWQYLTDASGTGQAIRVTGGREGRTWMMGIGDEEPACSGPDCP